MIILFTINYMNNNNKLLKVNKIKYKIHLNKTNQILLILLMIKNFNNYNNKMKSF
jgi:hypothetical protein